MILKSICNTMVSILLLLVAVLSIIFQSEVSQAVYEAFIRCITHIVPSLFSMSVISGIIMKCGVLEKMLHRTRIDVSSLNTFIFGNVGGYPIGAKLCADMAEDKNRSAISRLACSSFNCGPSFAISISYIIYGNAMCGVAAYASILLINLAFFIVYTIRHKPEQSVSKVSDFSTSAVVESVISSAHSMINITAMICAFAMITALLKCIFPRLFVSFVPAIFEISCISELQHPPLWIVASLLAFGGLCVQMQIMSIASSKYSLKAFYIYRLIHIPLCALTAELIDCIFKLTNSIAVSSNRVILSESSSIVPFICVIFMLIIALNAKRKQRMN